MKTIILILSVFLATSCSSDDKISFNATVLEKGQDCGNSFLIQFNEDIDNIPANNNENIFYEINLPEEYKIENLQITVEFREPTNDELMSCSSMGQSYLQIYIESVE
ncbi:MAG: hypothetical protein ACPH4O_03935 [Flavobacteriaceae bacterium]|jgi:hypothetical protein